jgi:lipopolysaccharide biosynthesis glycosyltransferase
MKIKVYFDDNYLEAFKNMIFSAVMTKKSDTKIVLEVGLWGPEGRNLSSDSRDSILDICRKLDVEVSFLTLRAFLDRWRPRDDDFSIPIDSQFARLDMMINANSDFLFLDVDLLMQGGWDDLLNLSPSDSTTAIMGVEDSWLRHLGTTHDEKYGNFYFNGGVLVFFVDPWKRYDLAQILISTIEKIDNSEMDIRHSLYDQDILNIMCAKNKAPLDRTFNSFIIPYENAPAHNYYRIGREFQPKVLHFISSIKPFKDLGKLKFEVLNMADSNANLGYIDSSHYYYYLYYFVQNQRKIWEKNS